MLTTPELYNLEAISSPLRALFAEHLPWHILARLDEFLMTVKDERLGRIHPTAVVEGNVYLAPDAVIGPHAFVEGPAWLGPGAQLGHSAYVRGGVIMAERVSIGHSSEVKHAVLLAEAKVAHLNYVGDSILGRNVNLGAGVKVANFKVFGDTIKVGGEDTGLRKFGGAIGDDVSIGCNAVVAPGALVGPRTIVYNGVMLRGVYEADSVVKLYQQVEIARRRDSL